MVKTNNGIIRNMEKRNEYLELDGLYWESDTHEWFHDRISTNYAQTDNGLNGRCFKEYFLFCC